MRKHRVTNCNNWGRLFVFSLLRVELEIKLNSKFTLVRGFFHFRNVCSPEIHRFWGKN